MSSEFQTAIVRPPAATFAGGITTAALGPPDEALALEQHAAYARALESCGVRVVTLPADPEHPDSTFVEDTAVILPGTAVLTRPGALARRGEVPSMRRALEPRIARLRSIEAPGTLDGGDVCEVGRHYFIGISERTNETGAEQLAAIIAEAGCASSAVDIRGLPILHLKSAMAALEENRIVTTDALRGHAALREYETIPVAPEEEYAANCVLVNGTVLMADGFPMLEGSLRERGYSVVTLEMSEYQKMDGGLSCLSLRF